tara:strand:+ start:248 stop:730 length:483 start_codon:yes stop_codon:yes gene_type:complete
MQCKKRSLDDSHVVYFKRQRILNTNKRKPLESDWIDQCAKRMKTMKISKVEETLEQKKMDGLLSQIEELKTQSQKDKTTIEELKTQSQKDNKIIDVLSQQLRNVRKEFELKWMDHKKKERQELHSVLMQLISKQNTSQPNDFSLEHIHQWTREANKHIIS